MTQPRPIAEPEQAKPDPFLAHAGACPVCRDEPRAVCDEGGRMLLLLALEPLSAQNKPGTAALFCADKPLGALLRETEGA